MDCLRRTNLFQIPSNSIMIEFEKMDMLVTDTASVLFPSIIPISKKAVPGTAANNANARNMTILSF